MKNTTYFGSTSHPGDDYCVNTSGDCSSHEEAEKMMLELGYDKFITVSHEPTKEVFRRLGIECSVKSMIESIDETISCKYGFDDICIDLEPENVKELSEIIKQYLLDNASFSFSVCDDVKEYDYREPDDGRDPL